MFKIFLMLFILSVSCTTVPGNPIEYRGLSIDKELMPYVLSFEDTCKVKVTTHVRFGTWMPTENTIGFCWPIINKFIHISPDWWSKNTDFNVREQLVFHELGHCELLRAHNDTMIPDKEGMRPASIMHHELMTEYYTQYKEFYVDELCRKNKLTTDIEHVLIP